MTALHGRVTEFGRARGRAFLKMAGHRPCFVFAWRRHFANGGHLRFITDPDVGDYSQKSHRIAIYLENGSRKFGDKTFESRDPICNQIDNHHFDCCEHGLKYCAIKNI